MTREETLTLIRYTATLDRGIRIPDNETLALTTLAWHDTLPTNLTPDQARAITIQLHRENQPITPGAITRRYNELKTPKHRQGTDTQPGPTPPPARTITPPPRQPLPPAPTPDPQTLAHQLDQAGIRRTPPPPPATRIECPYCHAQPGQPCHTQSRNRTRTLTLAHPSRYQAAGLPDPAADRLHRTTPPPAT